jgi:hypothetical protein
MDERQFTRDLEALYSEAWEEWRSDPKGHFGSWGSAKV